jgi:hypothetical protein
MKTKQWKASSPVNRCHFKHSLWALESHNFSSPLTTEDKLVGLLAALHSNVQHLESLLPTVILLVA